MAWNIRIGDKAMLLDDLTGTDLYNACIDYPEISWMQLSVSPGVHPAAFFNLVKAVATKLEVPVPDRPMNVREEKAFIAEHLERVDDDLPTGFSDGGIPLEDTEDETATTTSSTSTEPGTGTRTKQEAPPSET